jgi:hypothetical protein
MRTARRCASHEPRKDGGRDCHRVLRYISNACKGSPSQVSRRSVDTSKRSDPVSHVVSTWAWKQHVGDSAAKLVLIKLADQANDDGECWPARRTLATECEMSASTVDRKISLLVELELVVKELRFSQGASQKAPRQTSNLYRLLCDTPSSTVTTGGAHSYDEPPSSTVTNQEPSFEPPIEPSVTFIDQVLQRAAA